MIKDDSQLFIHKAEKEHLESRIFNLVHKLKNNGQAKELDIKRMREVMELSNKLRNRK